MADFTTKISAYLTTFQLSLVHAICTLEGVDYIYMGNGMLYPTPNFDFWVRPGDDDSINTLLTVIEDIGAQWNASETKWHYYII